MSHKAIYFDASLCVECLACRGACRSEYELDYDQDYLLFRSKETGEYPNAQYSICRYSCNHCQDAPCVTACSTGCLSKDPQTGMTQVEFEKCSGCGYCVTACPYDSVWLHDGFVTKCVGCNERIKNKLEPSCVEVCPTKALEFGDWSAMVKKGEKRVEQIKELYPNANLYGKEQLNGLHLVMVLQDKPETFGLAMKPEQHVGVFGIKAWQMAIQPLSLVGVAGAAVAVGGMYRFARKNHEKEMEELYGGHE